MSKPFYWFLPDPKAESPSPLRPHKKYPGFYELHREPEESEILYVEPGGNSYMLEFFECELKLRVLLKLDDTAINAILDKTWNFYHVRFDPDNPEPVEVLR